MNPKVLNYTLGDTAFAPGKSLSEQLRQERMELESTALKGYHGGSKDLTIHPNILKSDS